MKLNDKNKERIMVAIIVIIQTTIFIVAGINKSYLHMDEAYSLGLANYHQVEIQANKDFYNTWHNKGYYEDYLSISENERNNFLPVYENQKNDVHPPLYYLLLRVSMGFHLNHYSKWSGIIVNIILYVFITIFTYLIIKKLLYGTAKYKEKTAMLTLIANISLASINNAIYIRMYAFSTLNIIITTYLHLKLLEQKENNNKLLVLIGLSALVGSLTHYYYLFYLVTMFFMFVVKYIKEKQYKLLGKYIITMLLAGAISLLIFPYSIQHMFFGYRGQGVLNNLINIPEFFKRICQYIFIINIYTFHNILFILLIFLFVVIIYKKAKKIKLIETKNKYLPYFIFPTLGYFILVAISAPWIELRYMLPICSLIFILVLYGVMVLLKNITTKKTKRKIMIGIIVLFFVMIPISNYVIDLALGKDFRTEQEVYYSSKQEIVERLKNELNIPIEIFSKASDEPIDNILLYMKNFKIEPEVLYSNKKEIVETIKNNPNTPALYVFNSSHNRFLDDILLFANITESYIANDMECNEENIKKILLDKDISDGVLVFINDGQENEEIIQVIQKATNFNQTTYLQRLNACDVYYIENNRWNYSI